ncbi:hypothetical protein IW261DRAFT_1597010 [Armillaria novae-zelandiae]|uniref:Uncharacterized protein n=1 Tax=Armillaria novae-zelandiae TaxID=153914 RepID=A0AA39NUA3_9AGAR|nr:hypothetical protein IW261DRAFT_1597010 [Armillaria novae-zelandiae]
MAGHFFIGAEPFLFKIRGGPVPQYYKHTNKHLQDLADVYDRGPLADTNIHVAWRLYYHIVKLREMLDNEVFRANMRRLHSAPYEMLGVRGSLLLWNRLKEDARGWDNADGPGSLKKIRDEARRQEREDEELYLSNGEVQKQRREVAYISGDEDGDLGDVDEDRRKTIVRRVIPMDPVETNGSKDKEPACVTRSKRALGRKPGSDADEIHEAHPKKKHKWKGHFTSQDLKRLPPPEREKYLMSLPGKRKARTRCENCEELDLNCFLPTATKGRPNPACIQCRARCRGCSARKATSRSTASSSSIPSQVHSRAHTSGSEVDES